MSLHRVKLPTGLLTVKEESGVIKLDDICQFGARNNAKRGFLFVSKELGKHLPTSPTVMRQSHEYLMSEIEVAPEGPVVFVGMAETAIGLGYGVFAAWQRCGLRPAAYLHTTRYVANGGEAFPFEEGHSHAPNQFIQQPSPEVAELMREAKTLVLVDDEASTGRTFTNLWRVLRAWCPNVAMVNIATLTNFMDSNAREQLTQSLGVSTHYVQAVSGSWFFESDESFIHEPQISHLKPEDNPPEVPSGLGRLGITQRLTIPFSVWKGISSLLEESKCKMVRIVAIGEFMHAAIVLGDALEDMGYDVLLQSSTRSPVLAFGPIKTTLNLKDPYGRGDPYFIYNAEPDDTVITFILHETVINSAVTDLAEKINGAPVYWKDFA
ncbi:MAG: phosphoribosyltransferase domain-containing protein [Halothiobacillus sp.]|jgi:hypothetical protein|nr:phosphoribosyltransferase domain-containing protein [Halothiobacillus sp.]